MQKIRYVDHIMNEYCAEHIIQNIESHVKISNIDFENFMISLAYLIKTNTYIGPKAQELKNMLDALYNYGHDKLPRPSFDFGAVYGAIELLRISRNIVRAC